MKLLIARLLTVCLVALLAAAPRAQDYTTARLPELTTVGYIQEAVNSTINAVGESSATVGRIWMEGQTTSAKTCSAAGGCRFGIPTNSVTWANAATNLRAGFQDVDTSTGFEDGTFDAYVDMVPGTDTLSTDSFNIVDADSGTKTITHGDLVAFVVEMTARGGTDSVVIERSTRSVAMFAFPYGTADTGSSARNFDPIAFIIEFDDGTWGWFEGVLPLRNVALGRTTTAVNTGTTPDEYAAVVKFPVSLSIDGFGVYLSGVATTDTFELIVYENPLTSTPSVLVTFTVDPDQLSNDGVVRRANASVITLASNTYYGFAFRPTSANSITYEYFTLPTNGLAVGMKKAQFFTETILASRSNQTGAFSDVGSQFLPMLVVNAVSVIIDDYSTPPTFPVPQILGKLRTR